MYKSPYDTTYLQLQRTNLTLLINKVSEAKITTNQFHEALSPGKKPVLDIPLLTIVPGLAEIPPFIHPITIEETSKRKTVIVDTRNSMRLQRDGDVSIQSLLDYNFSVARGILQCLWNDENERVAVRNVGIIPMRLFARWITNNISIRRSLTLDAQLRVSIISAYFYFSLFTSPDDYHMADADLSRCVSNIAKATFADAKMVYDIIGDNPKQMTIPLLMNVGEFCNALVNHSQSLSLENMDSSFLYTVTGGSWFGANSREILAVALEHPPTWLAIVYTAAYERGYRNTSIGRMVQDLRKDDSEEFVNILNGLLYGRNRD